MYVNAVLTPPLGTSTVVDSCDLIRFLTALEVSEDSVHDWQVELWYGHKGAEWKSAAFTPTSTSELTLYDASKQLGRTKRIYTLNLQCTSNFKYTLRFRPSAAAHWIWINDQNNTGDGQIIFRQPNVEASVSFDHLFSDSDSDLKVRPMDSEVHGVDIFELSATVPASKDGWVRTTVGSPLSLEHFYALVKIRRPWMGPRQGAEQFEIDTADALMMGYLRSDGRHVVVLAISGLVDTTTYIKSGGDGQVFLNSRNDSDEPQTCQALVATGLDWKMTSETTFKAARNLLQRFGVTEDDSPEDMEPLWRETWYDGLGYCTWNSLGRELTHGRVIEALQDLHDKGVFISTVIIDDNWQTLDEQRRWERFEANEFFPKGLKGLTSEIRGRFSSVQHIAVWHAIIGYWEGVSPDGWIAQNYKCTTVKWHGGNDVTVVDEIDVERMYNDFYRFLRQSGIDCIKCDVQSSLSDFDHGVDRKRLGPAYQDAFKINGLKYFAGKVIYCMSMMPDIFFHSLLLRTGPTVLLRNSDDFYPDIPDSHPWHLFCNAMNNIFTSNFNVLPDWDMFQTSLPEYAGLHAAGRCISGGPIYITDSPYSHSLPLINRMSATSIRPPNRATILRPALVSLPLDPYIRYNSNRLLKISTVFNTAAMLAVFNVSQDENSELISLPEFTHLEEDRLYVLRQHSTGKIFGPASPVSDRTLLSLTLPVAGWEFLSALPVTRSEAGFDVAVLGLTGQLTGAAAVAYSWIGKDGAMTLVQATLKALGVLGIYVSDLKERRVIDMFVTILGKPVPVETVRKSKSEETLLEVDVLAAWKKLNLHTRWANEVVVKVFL